MIVIGVQKRLEGQIAGDRYPLIELLGSTSHSSVFRTGCDEASGNQAAIKLIPAPASTSEAQLTRWRLAASLKHPALLRIFDMGRCQIENRPMLYVVTELAEENLADVLPVRCLSSDEVNGMLGPVLDALAYLHGKGLTHAGLKPSNILAIGDQVKLSADSIARIGEASNARDALDPYRAPDGVLSPASDIWSLGITLVQCLTGRAPERQLAANKAALVPPSVPALFADVARHCLNPIAQRRWTVTQIQAALKIQAPVTPAQENAPRDPVRPAPSPTAPLFTTLGLLARVRRIVRLKKQHRLALAGFAVAAAAFVLGMVISGVTSDSTLTAPVSTSSARNSQPSPAMLASPLAGAISPTRARQSNLTLAASKPNRENSESRAKNANGPALIVSNVAPSEPGVASSASGGVVSGSVSRRAIPRVPITASSSISGTVRVSVIVDVDPHGHVVEAKLDSGGPSQYFARLSVAAAQDWRFTPPRLDGTVVPSEWLIDFGYSKSDISATASERHP